MNAVRKYKVRSERKVSINYGQPKLVVIEFKPEPVNKPKCGVEFVWEGGRIVSVKSEHDYGH